MGFQSSLTFFFLMQRESSAQQEYALQLQKRERCLTEQEALLFKHEAALAKIRGVEEEVHTKFGVMKEVK